MNGCPKCGGTTGYSLTVRALGYTVHTGQWDMIAEGGNERIADDSELRMIADKTVRCLDCSRRTLLKSLRAA